MKKMRISAVSDIVFKYLLGSRSSTPLLLSFLNAVQEDVGAPPFTQIEIINPINDRQFFDAKLSIIDVRAQASDGTFINVEVQVRSQAEFQERSLYYWARTYADQLQDGNDYKVLKPVLNVCLVDFAMFPDPIGYHSVFRLTEQDNPDCVLTEDCSLHFLELPKAPPAEANQLAQWIYALKHLPQKEDLTLNVLLKRNVTLKELADRYRRFENDAEARHAYLARDMFLHDQAQYQTEAREQGLAEGRAEGREQGKAEGLAEGRHEAARETTLDVARKMKSLGLDTGVIAQTTGLTIPEIAEL